MSNTEWTKNLKVGDEVALYYSFAAGCKYTIAIVERITPKGYIGVKGDLYDGTKKRGRGMYDPVLREVTSEVRKLIDDYKVYSTLYTKLDKMRYFDALKKHITVEQAQAIIDILEGEK